jgi:hypothetical protein
MAQTSHQRASLTLQTIHEPPRRRRRRRRRRAGGVPPLQAQGRGGDAGARGGGGGQGQGQRGPAAADAPYSPGQGGYEQQRGQRQSLIGCISRSGHESGDKANITVLKGFLTKVG